jgi:hypothetical protein
MPAAAANSSYVYSQTSPEESAVTKTFTRKQQAAATTATAKAQSIAESEAPVSDENVQLQSDPICSSSGCTQYKHDEQKPSYPMDYFVPNFGVDHHIVES